MKRMLFALIACPLLTLAQNRGIDAHAPLSGSWLGKIAGSLPIIFHFTAGDPSGTFDVPAQGAIGLPLEVHVSGDSLVCVIKSPLATYTAFRLNDTTFVGDWHQGPAKAPLEIHRLSGDAAKAYAPPARPQTPKPPFPYHSDSVEYDNAAHTVHFGGTLTYPNGHGPFPALVLITGSGIQDRDETIFGHKPFAVIADYLTRRGYAVLRVDDRTAGLSTGDLERATSADFAKDVETSVAWLRGRPMIDTKRVGLLGHSEGAMIAPMVAAADPSIAFIVLLAAPVEGGFATMGYQTLKPLELAHAPGPAMKAAAAREKILLQHIIRDTTAVQFVQGVDADYRAFVNANKDSTGHIPAYVVSPDALKAALTQQAPALLRPWWKFFLTYDPGKDFAHVSCPILALGGTKDVQVDNGLDLQLISSLVNPAEKSKVTVHELPGLNHLFQTCHTCTVDEYGRLEETFSPDALKTIGDWLDAHAKRP